MKIKFSYLKTGNVTYVDYVDGVLSSTDPAQQRSIERWLETRDEESFVSKFSNFDNGYVTATLVEENSEE